MPGPVIGMLLLLGLLVWRGNVPDDLETTARVLTQNLSLLFVPAGVGAIRFLPTLQNEWLPIGASIIGSVVLGICATTFAWRLFERGSFSPEATNIDAG